VSNVTCPSGRCVRKAVPSISESGRLYGPITRFLAVPRGPPRCVTSNG